MDCPYYAIFVYSLLFGLGLTIGSFINCAVYRLNHGLSPLKGRSFCPKCKHKIAWFDNIPLFSFIILRAKCRSCHSPVSWQYPLVELSTAILTLITFVLTTKPIFDSSSLVFNLFIVYALVAIFVSDLLYETIPDEFVFPAILLAFIYPLVTNHYSLSTVATPLLSALGAAAFFLLLHLVTRGRGMGLGDVKLAFLMGLILGWPKIIVSLYLAFLTGAFVGVILILTGKKKFGQHVPFGPFLVLATFVAMFWGKDIFNFFTSYLAR